MIIPFFIVYQGCPNRCIFCNIHKIAGVHAGEITEKKFQETVINYLSHKKQKKDHVQIAFYGGNFTGMEKERQIELLSLAHSFIRKGDVQDVRISTRPDAIDDDNLDILKRFGVTTVEIGAQSMKDEVLNLANRGHSSFDVIKAVNRLKEWKFKTGIHLMAGLPGDTRSGFEYTIDKTIALKPDMVRIHPTLVFDNTGLADLYMRGVYPPLAMPEAIDLCKYALRNFEEAHIPVIRLGLQMTDEMEMKGGILAGPYHPAFRSMVEESIFFDAASSLLCTKQVENKTVTFTLSPKDVSSFRGQKSANLQRLKKRFRLTGIRLTTNPNQSRRSLYVTTADNEPKSDFSDRKDQGARRV